MVGPVVPIGVMLGKADTAFKMVGGSSIIFNVIRSRIFGKVLRAVEYPDGELHSVRIYRMNLFRLKALIADTQPPPFPTAFLEPSDVKQVALFTSPHFTEPVLSDADVSALPENAWLFWSKDSFDEDPIPTRGVKLDGSHIVKKAQMVQVPPSDSMLQDRAISAARNIRNAQQLSRGQYDRIVDLAIDRDPGLLAIARNFATDRDEFRVHSMRLLERRRPKLIVAAEDTVDDTASAVSEKTASTEDENTGEESGVSENSSQQSLKSQANVTSSKEKLVTESVSEMLTANVSFTSNKNTRKIEAVT